MKIKRAVTIFIAALATFIFIIILGGFTTRALAIIQRPFLQIGTWVTSTTDSFRSQSSLVAENNDLQEKLTALAVFASELEILRDENDNLRLQLEYTKESQATSVTAAVTTRSISPASTVMTIDRGSDHGITIGNAVIVEQGIVIGKITDLSKSSSTVLLLSDRNSTIAASIQNSERTLGIVEGSGGSLLNFGYIPQNVEININDLVVTSGLEDTVPAGLVVGMINNIITNETDPFQNAVIEPLVDYRYYTFVNVITGTSEL
jgi:rod shape-determining protein MreC